VNIRHLSVNAVIVGEFIMPPEDLLIWPDGFWCFREELRENMLRGGDYRVVLEGSEEWIKLTKTIIPTPLRDKPL